MSETSADRPVVMISSTARDLPEHREEVLDACLRQSMTPIMQKHLPASGSDAARGAAAIRASLEMVDQADIYLGIFAHRYGYVPAGHDISITEMEYERSVERGITRLIFLMHDEHPILASDMETGEGAEKLRRLKERLTGENVVNFFKSPADLRADVINSLSKYRGRRGARDAEFHYVGLIPKPPEPYIAHPYTLRQTGDLVGRGAELRLLNDWVADPGSEVYAARSLYLVGLGGMGKSALMWKWFRHVAPLEMKPLAGSAWWSFYESNATFENFVASALAYVTGRTVAKVEREVLPGAREDQLFAALDRAPFLFVLDGLERLLVAYARAKDPCPEHPPDETADAPQGKRQPRKTTDYRVGNFLRKLANLRASRVLVGTRLFPAELETVTGDPLPGCFTRDLHGLSDKDALDFWARLRVRGTPEKLLSFFRTFGNLPLLIQTLAGVVARDKRACGDFDVWLRDRGGFGEPRKKVSERILCEALRDLDEAAQRVLHFLAALYMPMSYNALADLVVGKGRKRKLKLFADEAGLDEALVELEDRGLLGWDKRANRYDLHPVIREAVWDGLTSKAQREIHVRLLSYFTALCADRRRAKAQRLEDLTAEIERYHSLIKLGRFEGAARVFMTSVDKELAFRLSDHRRRAELLKLFFTEGLERPPRHKRPGVRAFIIADLATAYLLCGQLASAIPLYRKELEILWKVEDREPGSKLLGIVICLRKMGIALGHTAALREAEGAFRKALLISRGIKERFHEAICSQWWGILLATRGQMDEAQAALQRAERLLQKLKRYQSQGLVKMFLAQCELWRGDLDAAGRHADRALQLAQIKSYERDLARARRTRGAVAVARGARLLKEGRPEEAEAQLKAAEEDFADARCRARRVTHVREELQALIGLAELKRQRRDFDATRALLDDVLELTEVGPYPMPRADAYIMLAQMEMESDRPGAVESATQAFELSWCDGPPFAYRWGLEKAQALLRELGAVRPEMPAFDELKFEPMPDVEIDPPDESGDRPDDDEGLE